MGKMFIVIGIIFVVIGLVWSLFGKLPGDITIKKENFTFHFPIVTSIVVSIILSLIFYIVGKIR
ncbi:DUF2905 domain-containing protein [Lentibacillus cibarius]|uniref:DUF2905 domain-containing protein n=1 Tax=Lentibacillus cibarius TaxID=2583219 RepID=A0A549YLQ2_9BACI|nr:DUF2905 domain-containing protein [Lentibacillus cibarius]TMN21063.1 DUF2905 domain-containing protein [Lentibacillus cibarius]TRM12815.1 DUF2905 domain-containing protein [Lentibacillus cibarius]